MLAIPVFSKVSVKQSFFIGNL